MSHTCPAPTCMVRIPSELAFCRTHWYQIPKALRDRIWKHYREDPGGREHMRALTEAIRLLRRNLLS